MSDTDKQQTSDLENAEQHKPVAYAAELVQARKQKDLTVTDIAKELNITENIVEMLEASATEGLPPATFVQGYLRAYARLVDVSVDRVLEDFSRAVPHKMESDLDVRERLPKQATRHTPVIKSMTGILILLGIVVLGYGFYSYYSERVDQLATTEGSTASSIALAPSQGQQTSTIEQDARLDEEGELVRTDNSEMLDFLAMESNDKVKQDIEAVVAAPAALPEPDTITLYADRDSWIEITDGAGKSLFYNMLREGTEKTLEGFAPFQVFIGNAPVITMQINSVDIDMARFIRSNNVAKFRLTFKDDKPVLGNR